MSRVTACNSLLFLSGVLGGTNTSREMEDLQKVLQVADGTSTIYGDDSHRQTGKISNETTTNEYTKRDGKCKYRF